MKRAFIISDTHLGMRQNSIEWLESTINWFYKDFIEKVKKEYKPGDILIHAGDVFDNRQSINLRVITESIKLFEDLSDIFVDGIYIICGNHDILQKTSNNITSLDILRNIKNIHILKDDFILDVEFNKRIYFMPWKNTTKLEYESINNCVNKNIDYFICHTDFKNINYNKYVKVDDGITLNKLDIFDKVFSGHIHWRDKYKNLYMLGNPYQMTRNDTNNDKGFYLLDFKTSDVKFYKNEISPKFKQLKLDTYLDKTYEDLEKECKNNYIDLFVDYNYIVSNNITEMVDMLLQVAKRVELIPINEREFNIDDIKVNRNFLDSFDILKLTEKYVDESSNIDNTKKPIIKKIIKDIYQKINIIE